MLWLRRIAIGLLVALVLAGGAGWFVLRQSLPQLSGTIPLAGIGAPVEIVRDRYAIPHIEAQSLPDAYFALGFVHAQDRLWQMETQRRIAAGRLAELFGSAVVDIDRVMRTLGLRRYAEQSLDHLAPDIRAALEAYAAGVNAFIARTGWPLPVEFLAFNLTPEPWTPADSLAWIKVMAWDLGGSFRSELLRMALAKQGLSNGAIEQFLPPYPGDGPVALPGLAALYRDIGLDPTALAAALPGAPGTGIGSNNWVVSGARSATSKPLLANDPHLGLSTPSLWYLVHWRTPQVNAIGGTLPGVPIMVLGRTDRIAWGFTNTGPDVQDLYIERVDPADPARYAVPGGSAAFETRTEVIKVRGAPAVTVTVRATRHGPVISDAIPRLSGLPPDGHVLALAWTALTAEDSGIEAGFRAIQAQGWTDFVAAFRDYVAPQQNIVYADIDGNIGFLAPGRVPIRKPENDLQGLAPMPGWDARYDWAGFIPFDELPRAFNPPAGKIVTANNKIVPDGYPYAITHEWQAPFRARRIEQMLAMRPAHSLDSFKQIQADVVSTAMLDLLPFLRQTPAGSAKAARALDLLRAWDGSMAGERPEPLIAVAWLRELTRLIYADELGEAFRDAWALRIRFLENVLADRGGQSAWCDDATTPAREACSQLLVRALELALDGLEQAHGSEMRNWRWGDAHATVAPHRPFGNLPVLASLFDVSVPTPGDSFTVNVGRHDIRSAEQPFANRHAAGYRAIYDLADLDRSVFIQSTGQSGNWMSPQYDAFADIWRRVDYVPMSTRRTDYLPGNLGRLLLRPAP